MKFFGLSHRKLLLLLWAVVPLFAAAQNTNGVLREVYRGLSAGNLSTLTNLAKFPASPDEDSILTNYFEIPINTADYYGTRLRALLLPPETGTYYFYIASDDGSQLLLSTDENPANKRVIASVSTCTASRQYTKEANQKSAGIQLTNGLRYYIEAIQAEGGGADNLAVAWQKPGEADLADGSLPISATNAIPYGLGPPVIVTQPANTSGIEGGMASFTVKLERNLGATFQWQRNGTNLPAATGAVLTVGPLSLADSNATFRCSITNTYGATNSATVTLKVTPDVTAPTIVSANPLGNRDMITMLFSEAVDPVTATNAANYRLSYGSVQGASLGPDAQTIVLHITPITNTSALVYVSNIRDLAATPNTIRTNSGMMVSFRFTPLETAVRWPQRESPGPSTRNGPLVISEIMYHPRDRADGRNLEFLELYNSQPWPEEIGGFRITGAVEYTFPTGTVIGATSRVVVAAAPADLQAVYGLTGVYGPFSGRLQNDAGTVRLRNHLNAVLWETEYSDEFPYPAAADGAGHSLVLMRPSYGEKDPRAWGASELAGGSPGSDEPAAANPYRAIVINELLAHPTPLQGRFVELYNYSSTTISLNNCALTDDPATNKYVFPTNVAIQATAYLVLTEEQLGFSLPADGGVLCLMSPGNSRVIDAIKYGGQQNGQAYGRYPDGADELQPLESPTSGAANASVWQPPVVINEIMFDPITEDDDDEYLELYNPGTNAVDLSRWRLAGAVKYTFPTPCVLGPGDYLVVGAQVDRLRTNYPHLNVSNALGNFSGHLANNGERLRLQMPVTQIATNALGQPSVSTFYATVDEAVFAGGGRWGDLVSGGGSSLELVYPRSNHRTAPAWAASDETGKSGWVTIEHTGVLDNGQATADSLQLFLLGEGECLVDEVEVIPAGGNNLIANSDFQNGTEGWVFQGTHERSSWESGQGFASPGCLHVRASARGDTGANRIRTPLGRVMNAGETATIRARVRWLAGHPEILLRLRGSYLEATGDILTSRNLGTPGLRNSRAAANCGPSITEVTHTPVLPTAGQAVRVIAKVADPDGLSALYLRYRVDPATNWNTVSMSGNGAGFFSGIIPGQTSAAIAAFYLQAADGAVPVQSTLFPNDAPARECVVRWGETAATGSIGTYRLWLTKKTLAKWMAREKLSNDQLDTTFIYGNQRVIYNAGCAYSGSPYHSPSFNSPIGAFCDYALSFPADDRLLGDEELTMQWPGNGGGDASAQNEQHAYWIGYQLGLPYCHRRYANLLLNGTRSGSTVLEDVQQPNRSMMAAWYPDNDKGDLHKIQIWFEFDDAASTFSGVGATMGKFTTTGGVKKLARYRWNWAKRAYGNQANDYAKLYQMMDTATTTATGEAYGHAIESVIDVDEWARHFLTEKLVGNTDSYGNGGGQNMFTYCPGGGTWKMLIWDIDFAFYSAAPTSSVFNFSDSNLGRIFKHPPFARAYWRAIEDAVTGPLLPTRSTAMLNYRYATLQANGINAGSPDVIKNYVSNRLQYLTGVLEQVKVPFQITSLPLTGLTTNRNLIAVSGIAPIQVKTILINGSEVPVVWTSVTNWTAYWSLGAGANQINVSALNAKGAVVPEASASIPITYTGPQELPQDYLVINEIMARPAWPDAAYVELYNRSTNSAFDLSNWRLHGLDYTFPPGTVMQPGGFLVVTKNLAAFTSAYGASAAVVGEFDGNLDPDGETLRLEKPGTGGAQDVVIDQVTYESEAPWPMLGLSEGTALQLMDAAQDNNRVGNWAVVSTNQQATPAWQYVSASGTAGSGALYVYLQSAGDAYLDDVKLVAGSTPEAGANLLENGDFESALTGPWTVSANHSGSAVTTAIKHGGAASLHLVASSGGTTRASSIWQDISSKLTAGQTYTLSFWYRPGASGGPLTLRFSGSWISRTVTLSSTLVQRATPGAANSVARTLTPFAPVWLNEVGPNNYSGPSDRTGEHDPWIELYNGGTNTLSLAGFYLSDSYTNLTRWAFPTNASLGPKQFSLVWLDGEPGEATAAEHHASFRIGSATGAVALASVAGGKTNLLHYLNYRVPGPDRSYGLYADGNASGRRTFGYVTPRTNNNPAYPPLPVVINEWMTDNLGTLADAADNQFEDWFELYNPGPDAAELSGYFLTDELTNTLKFPIPSGTAIPAGGYLLVWADSEPDQNGGSDLHANFKLSSESGLLALHAPDGTLVDRIVYGLQGSDVSEGRLPNGGPMISSLTVPSPRSANLIILLTNQPPTLVTIPNQAIPEGELLTFTALAYDPDSLVQSLTFSLGPNAPLGATLSPEGIFSWLPAESQGGSNYLITLVVTDNGEPALSNTMSFTITVDKVNSAPTLITIGEALLTEDTTYSFQVSASDGDLPAQAIRFSLTNAPPGAAINPTNGLFSWTPTEAQGPGAYVLTVLATDDGEPALTASQDIRMFVLEENQPPVLAAISSRTALEGVSLHLAASASDADVPKQTLTYSLDAGAPSGMTISTGGILSWTPAESQGGSNYWVTVRVTDDGSPALSAETSFQITVNEVNRPPILQVTNAITINEQQAFSLLIAATDPDEPAQEITFSLTNAPAGATINPTNGLLSWTPSEAQGPGTYLVTVMATDNGNPPLTATQAIQITVAEVNTSPVLAPISNQTVAEGSPLVFTASATDPDEPAQILVFTLAANAPAGASISTNGVFAWTPAENQGGSNYWITIRVHDNGIPSLNQARSFQVTVAEVNRPPALAMPNAVSITEGQAYSLQISATDLDEPAQRITFHLTNSPAGASINPTNGLFTWTPSEAQGPGLYAPTILATDDGVPPLTAAQTLQLTVLETNQPPALPALPDLIIAEGTPFMLDAGATDSDVPAQILTYQLATNAPAGMRMTTNGLLTWTPTEHQGGTNYWIRVQVTDSGTPPLSDTRLFCLSVAKTNQPPVLSMTNEAAIIEMKTLSVQITATDGDEPTQHLTFSLTNAPPGAMINATNGLFTWTPSEAQGPGIYPITILATDDGTPPLSDARILSITVWETNQRPNLVITNSATVKEGVTFSFQAVATDLDEPAQQITFSLSNSPPAGAELNPTNGWFTFTPSETQGGHVYLFSINATDDAPLFLTMTRWLRVTVEEDNQPPSLAAIPSQTVAEGTRLRLVASATDADLPAQALTFSLAPNAPTGAAISTNGIFTWTPANHQGGTNYWITVRVTDNGAPAQSNEMQFQVTVAEVNQAPVLAMPNEVAISEGELWTLQIAASDPDEPAQQITFSLTNAPAGAAINPTNGVLTWRPSESQGGTNYAIPVRATDAGSPPLADEQVLWVTVAEVNQAPVLSATNAATVSEGERLTLQIAATDPDEPAQQITFSLTNAPAGAEINPTNGVLSWTPTEEQGPGMYPFSVLARDNGVPPLSDEQVLWVVVKEVNQAPVLSATNTATVSEGELLTLQITASDPDEPAQQITFSLTNAPAGAAINPTNGVLTWRPSESQGGTNYTITVRATDAGSPPLADEQVLWVTVAEINQAPVLAMTNEVAISEGELLTLQIAATDLDEPAQQITFSLTNAPAGAEINPTNGVVSWTPSEEQGPGMYLLAVLATDDGVPPLSATQALWITVRESNQAPVLGAVSNQVAIPGRLVAIDLQATDADLPAQTLTFQWEGTLPAGASLSPEGQFRWTPAEDQAGSTNLVVVRVTDSATPAGSATNSFLVIVGTQPKFAGGAVSLSGDQITLAFQTTPGISYQIQYKDQLSDATWSNLGDPQTATGISLTIRDQIQARPTRFYRVIVAP